MSSPLGIVEYLKTSAALRQRRLAAGCLIAVVASIAVVRQAEAEFEAQVRVFAGLPSSSAFSAMSMAMPSFYASMERDTLITSQEAIVRSEPIFTAVTKNLEAQGLLSQKRAPPGTIAGLKRQLKSLLFGADYVASSDRWSNERFDTFQKQTTFSSSLDAGTFVIGHRQDDPKLAIETVRVLAAAVIEKNVELSNRRWGSVADFLRIKLKDGEAELEASSKKISSFVKEHSYFNSDAVLQAKFERLLVAQEARELAAQELHARSASREIAETQIKTLTDETRDRLTSGQESKTHALLDEMRSLEAALAQAYKLDVTQTETILKRLEELRGSLQTSLSAPGSALGFDQLQSILSQTKLEQIKELVAQTGAKVRLEDATRRVAAEETAFRALPDLHAQLTQMLVNHAQLQRLYELIMGNFLNASIQSDVKVSNLVVFEEPQLVRSLLTASKTRQLAMLIILSLFSVFVGSGLFDVLRGVIVSRRQLLDRGGAEFLGSLPHVRGAAVARSAFDGEAGARLATALLKRLGRREAGDSPEGAVVQTASLLPMAGKSTIALALAGGMTRRALKVALVDCDIRATTRSVSTMWSSMNGGGAPAALSDVLGDAGPNSIAKLQVAHFAVPEGQKLDGEMRRTFQDMIKELRRRFDIVILDGPPLAFADALFMLEVADGIIACCPEGRITESELDELLRTVHQLKGEHAVVFTTMTDTRASRNADREIAANYYSRRRAA